MENQSKTPPPRPQKYTILNVAALIGVAALWGLTAFFYSDLPEKVPMFFSKSGQPIRFDDRSVFLHQSIVATALVGLFSVLAALLDFLQKKVPGEGKQLLRLSSQMFRWLRLSVLAMFILMVWAIGSTAKAEGQMMPTWVIPVALGLVIAPVFFFLFQGMISIAGLAFSKSKPA